MDNKNSSDTTGTQEMLNALADGQLPAHEREKILAMIDQDAKLSNEVCEIYRIKDLINTAYPLDGFKENPEKSWSAGNHSFMRISAYFIVFLFTLGTGYLLGETFNLQNPAETEQQVAAIQKNKVIVFLNSSDPVKYTQALYQAESLAQQHQKTNGEVYVVTSAEGIDLLNKDTTPYQQKIIELSNSYPSLKFIACNNTMYMREKEGKNINLIAQAEVVPSAVDFVASHLLRGWQYISI